MVAGARREAMLTTCVGLGLMGFAMAIAAEQKKRTLDDIWKDCTGRHRWSGLSGKLGHASAIFILVGVVVGLSQAWRGLKSMARGRLCIFCPRRSKRWHVALWLSLAATLGLLYFSAILLWEASQKEGRKIVCPSSRQQLEGGSVLVGENTFYVGGALGTAACLASAIFFFYTDVREAAKVKERRLQMRAWGYRDEESEGEDTEEEEDGEEQETFGRGGRGHRSNWHYQREGSDGEESLEEGAVSGQWGQGSPARRGGAGGVVQDPETLREQAHRGTLPPIHPRYKARENPLFVDGEGEGEGGGTAPPLSGRVYDGGRVHREGGEIQPAED